MIMRAPCINGKAIALSGSAPSAEVLTTHIGGRGNFRPGKETLVQSIGVDRYLNLSRWRQFCSQSYVSVSNTAETIGGVGGINKVVAGAQVMRGHPDTSMAQSVQTLYCVINSCRCLASRANSLLSATVFCAPSAVVVVAWLILLTLLSISCETALCSCAALAIWVFI